VFLTACFVQNDPIPAAHIQPIFMSDDIYCLTISLAVIPDYRTLPSYLRMFATGKIQRSVV